MLDILISGQISAKRPGAPTASHGIKEHIFTRVLLIKYFTRVKITVRSDHARQEG